MTYEEKRALYERIMENLAPKVKQMINEAVGDGTEKKLVCFTGKSKYFTGEAAERFIKQHTDFKTTHTVDERVSLIIIGEKPGPDKMKKAEELGIQVMSEEQFYKRYDLTDELPEPRK